MTNSSKKNTKADFFNGFAKQITPKGTVYYVRNNGYTGKIPDLENTRQYMTKKTFEYIYWEDNEELAFLPDDCIIDLTARPQESEQPKNIRELLGRVPWTYKTLVILFFPLLFSVFSPEGCAFLCTRCFFEYIVIIGIIFTSTIGTAFAYFLANIFFKKRAEHISQTFLLIINLLWWCIFTFLLSDWLFFSNSAYYWGYPWWEKSLLTYTRNLEVSWIVFLPIVALVFWIQYRIFFLKSNRSWKNLIFSIILLLIVLKITCTGVSINM